MSINLEIALFQAESEPMQFIFSRIDIVDMIVFMLMGHILVPLAQQTGTRMAGHVCVIPQIRI